MGALESLTRRLAALAAMVALASVAPAAAKAADATAQATELAPAATLSAPASAYVTLAYHAEVASFGGGAAWPIRAWSDALAPYRLEPSLAFELARWDGRGHSTESSYLWDASVTPTLRWRPASAPYDALFVQAGIGAHLLSATSINHARHFGSTFQFGERLAGGMSFGAGRRFEAALYIQHVSNARIAEPNDGLTLYGIFVGMRLD